MVFQTNCSLLPVTSLEIWNKIGGMRKNIELIFKCPYRYANLTYNHADHIYTIYHDADERTINLMKPV